MTREEVYRTIERGEVIFISHRLGTKFYPVKVLEVTKSKIIVQKLGTNKIEKFYRKTGYKIATSKMKCDIAFIAIDFSKVEYNKKEGIVKGYRLYG